MRLLGQKSGGAGPPNLAKFTPMVMRPGCAPGAKCFLSGLVSIPLGKYRLYELQMSTA